MNKSYLKSIISMIKSSLGRFLSIISITFLASIVFVGLFNTSDTMRDSFDAYSKSQSLYDYKLFSKTGFTSDDLVQFANYQPTLLKEFDSIGIANEKNYNFKVVSLTKEQYQNLKLVEGRFPTKDDEILLVKKTRGQQINLNNQIQFKEEANSLNEKVLNQTQYTVVGIIEDSQYASNIIGTTTLGDGNIAYVTYVPIENFKIDRYTALLLRSNTLKNDSGFSKEYQQHLQEEKSIIQTLANTQSEASFINLKNEAQQKVNDAKQLLIDETTKAKQAIEQAKTTLNQEQIKGQQQIDDAKQQLAAGKQTYAESLKEFNTKKQQYQQSLNEYNQNKQRYENHKSTTEQLFLEQQTKTMAQFEERFKQLQQQLVELETQLQSLSNDVDPNEREKIETSLQYIKASIASYSIEKNALQQRFETGKKEMEARFNEQYRQLQQAEAKLITAKVGISSGEQQLKNSEKQLQSSEFQIEQSQRLLDEKIAENKRKIAENEANLTQKTNESEAKIIENEQQLTELKQSSWIITTRDENYGYKTFNEQSESMRSLATVFPVIFYSVAIFVVLMSMMRLVEEERLLIGTFKSLGYTNIEISLRYIIYAALGSLIGSISGSIIGMFLIPTILYETYRLLFALPPIIYHLNYHLVIISVFIGTSCILVSTIGALFQISKEKPAQLLQSKLSTTGKRIFLENIPLLWNKLSFTQKITARNIWFNRFRFFMSIIGIAGCITLVLSGLAISENVKTVSHRQFNDYHLYQTQISYRQKDDFLNTLLTNKETIELYNETLGLERDSVILYAFNNNDQFHQMIGSKQDLGEGIIITNKIAHQNNINIGNIVPLKSYNNDKQYQMKVIGITDNYIGNYIYTSKQYVETFKKVDNNLILSKKTFDETTLLSNKNIQSITTSEDTKHKIDTMINSIDLVIVVIIVFAGLLTFVVVYNLSIISISERQKELATLKVLGFYNKEVNRYVFREIIVLSILGSITGLIVGRYVYKIVLATIETVNIAFPEEVSLTIYGLSFIITMIFTLIVCYVMQFKIKAINMLEALKSVE